jgi:apolipoprotein D and lipocalin family protein
MSRRAVSAGARWVCALAVAGAVVAGSDLRAQPIAAPEVGRAPLPAPSPAPVLEPLPSLHVPGYMGTWYQVAWFPNRFQKQCVSDTTATYRRVEGGVEVINRCRTADGKVDAITGLARPSDARLEGDQLQPARLEVSFLPRALRWLPFWGDYWVLMRAEDGRFAVVSEPRREYLWVLSRGPMLAPADEVAIRSRLGELGFDLARWQLHTHPATPSSASPGAVISPSPPTTLPAPPR